MACAGRLLWEVELEAYIGWTMSSEWCSKGLGGLEDLSREIPSLELLTLSHKKCHRHDGPHDGWRYLTYRL